MSGYTQEEIDRFVAEHGCFCGGCGKYTDYNCGASFDVSCPHCRGSGKKRCDCKQPSLRCP